MDFQVSVEIYGVDIFDLRFEMFCLAEAHTEEELHGLVCDKLLSSLRRSSVLKIEDLSPVFGRDSNTNSFICGLVKSLSDAFVVVVVKSSLLHELDTSGLSD